MAAKNTTGKTQKETRRAGGRGRPGVLTGIVARILVWVTVVTVIMGILYGTIVGARWLLFTGNDYFTLQQIEVEATPNLRKEGVVQILEQMGIHVGATNLFTIHLRDVRDRLEHEVVVARSEVHFRLPDTLAVRLYERSPVAKLRCVPRYLMDEEGMILPYWETRGDSLLPEITAIRDPGSLSQGSIPDDPALLGAGEFLRKIRSRPEGVAYDVALIQLDYYLPSLRVHLRRRDIFRNGAEITVPIKGMDAALDRLRDIVRLRAEAGKSTSSIDVTYEKNCPVR